MGQFSSAPAIKVVLLVSRDFAVAYACDNKKAAALVGGRVGGGLAAMDNVEGAVATARYNALGASGIFSLPGTAPEAFVASPATSKAGFYVADLATKAGHWVVAANGTSAGVLRLNGTIISNPPVAPSLSTSGGVLHPVPTAVVTGYPTSPVFPDNPIYPNGPI